ncbi:MAG: hypothetical protein WAV90_00245 [Gordonia amarae]
MPVNRDAIQSLAAKCHGGDTELDELITYSAIALCDPGGLTPLLAAAYADMSLETAQSAIDHLVLDGYVAPASVGGITTNTYVPTAA